MICTPERTSNPLWTPSAIGSPSFTWGVMSLPAEVRAIWDKAKAPNVNIGVHASAKPYCFEIKLAAKTVKSASAVGASIVYSVYAPAEPSGCG